MTCGQFQWLSQWPGYLVLIGLSGCLGGCSLPANPHTSLQAGPFGGLFKFYDSKDNDLELEDANFDPQTKGFTVKKLTIRNNASDPRRANVEQIQAYTEQVKATTEMFSTMTKAIASAVPLSRWSAAASVPGEKPDDGLKAIIGDAVKAELRKLLALKDEPAPATQEAGP